MFKRPYLILGLVVLLVLVFVSPYYLKAVVEGGNLNITVAPSGWSGNLETDQVEEMEAIEAFTKIQFPQDPSAAFRMYGIRALSETIVFLRVGASKDYFAHLLAGNQIDPGTSVAKLIKDDFAYLSPGDVDLTIQSYYPKGPGSRLDWWTPEEIRDATHTRTRFNSNESFLEGIHGFTEAGGYTAYFHIIHGM